MQQKSIALSLFLFVVTAMCVNAQGLHLGIKAGTNIFKVDGQSFNSQYQFGYNVGAFAEINFPGPFGIQPELNFSQTNYRTGEHFSDMFPSGTNDVKGKLRYLSIPILLSFKPVPFLSLQAGPQFGILLNGDQHLVNNAGDAFKKGDFSLVGGAQLNLGSLKIGGRYVIGLNDINDLGNGDGPTPEKWKNQGFQLYAGFRIF
jgi:hypothetical protein